MENKKINENPARFAISKTQIKKGLFSKKEITLFAIADENEKPLTDFSFEYIQDYEDGIVCAGRHNKPCQYFDINGNRLMKEYSDLGYKITYDQEYFIAVKTINDRKGLFNKQGKALIDSETTLSNNKHNNYIERFEDIVVYGFYFAGHPDTNKLGLGRLENGEFISVIPPCYNLVKQFDDRIFCVGRTIVKQEIEHGLLKDTRKVTVNSAFQLYSADTGEKISDLVFGEIVPKGDGTYAATVYPKIKPENLCHEQTFSEAFTSSGLLDFSQPAVVFLDENYNIIVT